MTDDQETDDSTATLDERARNRAESEAETIEFELPPRFQAKRVIGKGGMGVVVEVLDRNLGREVAVKILAPDKRDPVHRVRFRREAKAAAVLRHPNIVTVHDVDTERDFIVMELVRGESLRQWLKRDRLLSPADVRRVGLALLDALAAAHDAKIIHRDIKPGNILIDDKGVIKLVDFGIASFGDRDLTSTGMRIGTPAYRAPEQLRGRVADVRADLYAVGATLFEAATGTQLHAEGRTPQAAGEAVLTACRDEALARVIERAVAELPEDRFQSARELADALRAETPVPAPPPKPRRRRWVLALAGLVVVAGVTTAIVLATRDEPGATADARGTRRIAVLPFVDRTGEPRLDFSATGLPHILSTELKAIPELDTLGYYDLLDRVLDPAAPIAKWKTAATELGAQLVVHGELVPDPGGVRLVVLLESIEGASMGRFERVTTIDAVPAATRAIAAEVARGAVGRGLPASQPRKFDVDRDLQLAIAAIERQDLTVADEHLQKVELQAPDLAEAQYYRALLNWWLSRPIQEAVTRALAGNLDPAQRGFMEGLRLVYHSEDLTPAIATFRELVTKFPDHRDIQYGLFEALYHGGYPAEAMVVYRRLGERHPRFRLGIKHALAYYVGHANEDGMTWAIPRLDPELDETVLWQARALVARRDYAGAIVHLRRHDPAGNHRDIQRELAAVYFLTGELGLAADISAGWPNQDLAHTAVDLLGMATARGATDEAARWSDKAASAAELATGADARERGWLELAGVELPEAHADRLARIAKNLATVNNINGKLAQVLVAGALGDRAVVEAARTSTFPEVVAVVDAYRAEWNHDAKAASAAWSRAADQAADGYYAIVERLAAARTARASDDHAGVLGACDAVIRPHRFTWAWGGAVGPCLRWSAEAATALGRADDARAAWTQLLALRAKAPATDELAAAARAAVH